MPFGPFRRKSRKDPIYASDFNNFASAIEELEAGGGGGGGAVDSVNGQTGVVVLDQDDVGDGSTYKRYSQTEKTKLSGIETAADVTDATNVDAAGAVMNADTSTAAMSFVVDEDLMTSNSATKVPTQQSVKAYADLIANGANLSDTTHANLTAAHGATGAVVGTTNAQTLTNKTLTAPTIADFTNAGHDHLDADDGGTLSAAAIASGTLGTARLGSGTADNTTYLRGDQTWATPAGGGGGISNVVDDTTPQLGGDLDLNDHAIVGGSVSISESFGVLLVDATTISINDPMTTQAISTTGNISVTGTVDGRDVAADGTKLDGIEAAADVTDAGNVGPVLTGLSATTIVSGDSFVFTDASDSNLPKRGLVSSLISSLSVLYQSSDSDLTAIAGLSPSNDDVIQRKSGAWTNRTMAQVKTDLALAKGDVGLGNVDNTSNATERAAAATLTNKTLTSPVINTPTGIVKGDVGLGNVANVNTTPRQIVFVFDGGGSEIPDNQQEWVRVPFACTITGVYFFADQTGSIVADLWKDTNANYPPTDADSITSSTPPTISSSTKNGTGDTTLTSWTTTLAAGDILKANVDSCTTITHAVLCIAVTQTS